MIVFIVSAEHHYTLEEVVQEAAGPKVQIATYDQILGTSEVQLATYVFTDFDRLPISHIRVAAQLYRKMRAAGLRVLNDPARVLSRFGLLRRLYNSGLNSFNAYRVEDEVLPERWPVFLRTEGDHGAPFSELLHNPAEIEQAINNGIDAGLPLTGMLIVEFAAEPVIPGLYRKLSAFRIGDTYVATNCVHQDHWLVKYGTKGIAPPELYEEELRIVRENPFEAAIKPAFEAAGLEYGRIDFGIVDGKVQTYEINSNPNVNFPTEHPSEHRLESFRIFKRNFFAALAGVDTREA